MDATEICHRRVLPAVMVFALGVLTADFANEHRERETLNLARDQAQHCQASLLDETERRSRFQRMAHYAIDQGNQCREQLAVATLPLSLPIAQAKGGK
ncbi:hypothetical protein [uncultured Sphaerotilus sp.]|uniref:hypothetical protein n=1 Tax=uncultured Sphaerotilus sp. TaxID=474984 RepID=UPI0030CA3D07